MYKKFHLFAAIFCLSLATNAQRFKIRSYYDSHQTFYEYQGTRQEFPTFTK